MDNEVIHETDLSDLEFELKFIESNTLSKNKLGGAWPIKLKVFDFSFQHHQVFLIWNRMEKNHARLIKTLSGKES